MARNKYNIDEELDAPFNWQQFKRALVYVKKYAKQKGYQPFMQFWKIKNTTEGNQK